MLRVVQLSSRPGAPTEVQAAPRRRAVLTTDASGLAVAAILMQSEFDDEPESHPSPSINWRTVGESRN